MPSTDDFTRSITSFSDVMDGCLFQPCSSESPHLLGFVHNQHALNVLFLIPGLTEGFMSLKWTRLLADRLKSLNFALVQVNLRSSFNGFGFSSLKIDAEELLKIIRFSCDRWGYKKCFLLGHSTGAQICNYFMQTFNKHKFIDGIIFHSGISDREAMSLNNIDLKGMHEEAKKYIQNEEIYQPLSKLFFNAPISAYRFESFYKRLGDDDMFSTDLSNEELKNIFKELTCAVLMIYGENDEYVPNQNRLREFVKRLCSVLKELGSPIVECEHMLGNHSFSDESMYAPMVEIVARFLQHIL